MISPVCVSLCLAMAATGFAEEFVPQWAKQVVWYQIFPERFCNGDASNDPTLADMKGAYPDAPGQPWELSRWSSDWYELQSHEKANGQPMEWNLVRRRYGGDLQGVIDKLDYLKQLGIGAIYMNPIFMSPSMHKYDGVSYHHVDPNFGPDPAGDRALIAFENPLDERTWVMTKADKLAVKLIAEVHKRGMKIIFDGVFNHMGVDSFAFRDVVEKQKASAYRDWFEIESWDDAEAGTKFAYKGWFGFQTLPELKEDANGIADGPRAYIFAATRRWMDPDGDGDPGDGIDGWRLDVAFCVAHPFWKAWRKHVKAINPESYLTAEVIEPIDKLKPYLQGDEFDAVMNYNFAFACADFFASGEHGITPKAFAEELQKLRDAFPKGVSEVQQNLFGSHDTNRVASHIVNRNLGVPYRDWGSYFGKSQGTNPAYLTRKPTAAEYEIQKLIALMQMTYVGAPMIYYGDEVGMWGANDPCCRKPMLWPEMKYDAEVFNYDGSKRTTPDEVAPNQELRSYYQKLIHIRNAHPALSLGSFETLLAPEQGDVFAFRRADENEEIIVTINRGAKASEVTLPVEGKYRTLLGEGGLQDKTLKLPAVSGVILLRE